MGKSDSVKKAHKHKKAVSVKETEMPKQPKTAYFLFMDDHRDKIATENMIKNKDGKMVKDMKKVSKILGKSWKELTPDQKAVYTKQAEHLKLEFSKKKNEYLEKHPKSKKEKKKSKKTKKSKRHVKAVSVSSDSSDSGSESE